MSKYTFFKTEVSISNGHDLSAVAFLWTVRTEKEARFHTACALSQLGLYAQMEYMEVEEVTIEIDVGNIHCVCTRLP